MNNFEEILDKSIETAIDSAVKMINEKYKMLPFSFLVDEKGKFVSVVPNTSDFNFEDAYLVDSFKDFGQEKLQQTDVEGFCVTYRTRINLKSIETESIAVFLKFKNDILPLKTRIYYFPYEIVNGKPYINFEESFSSEA